MYDRTIANLGTFSLWMQGFSTWRHYQGIQVVWPLLTLASLSVNSGMNSFVADEKIVVPELYRAPPLKALLWEADLKPLMEVSPPSPVKIAPPWPPVTSPPDETYAIAHTKRDGSGRVKCENMWCDGNGRYMKWAMRKQVAVRLT